MLIITCFFVDAKICQPKRGMYIKMIESLVLKKIFRLIWEE